MSVLKAIATGISVAALCGCAHSAGMTGEAPTATAYAAVNNPSGQQLGIASLSQDPGGTVHIQMKLSGLVPGWHGVHIHSVGSCMGPAFASAGGHFNPEAKHHGMNNPQGPHAGDLPNMIVDASGNANYTASTNRVSLTSGASGLMDADGSALVVHASPDDNMSDPAGNAGARIACGAIRSGTATI
jgi:superoxide dismutase, Cu-Zn family